MSVYRTNTKYRPTIRLNGDFEYTYLLTMVLAIKGIHTRYIEIKKTPQDTRLTGNVTILKQILNLVVYAIASIELHNYTFQLCSSVSPYTTERQQVKH